MRLGHGLHGYEFGKWARGYYNWLSGELIERLNLECVVEFWWRHRVRNDYAILLSIFCFHVYLFIFTGGESTRNMCIIFACYCQDDCEEIINIEEFFTFILYHINFLECMHVLL